MSEASSFVLPACLPHKTICDRAVDIARSLAGMRTSDAVAILETSKGYILQSSVSQSDRIPPRRSDLKMPPISTGAAV